MGFSRAVFGGLCFTMRFYGHVGIFIFLLTNLR
jgi:hypothetical protein